MWRKAVGQKELKTKGKLLGFITQAGICLFLLLCLQIASAAVDDATSLRDNEALDLSTFDHLATGFALDGNHALVDCEACHVGGVFEGLPTTCESCHDNVFSVGKDSNHIPTTENCDVCHTALGFQSTAATTIMDHSLIGQLACSACHDGISATGKGPIRL